MLTRPPILAFLFGVIFAGFASIGRTELVFTCNAVCTILASQLQRQFAVERTNIRFPGCCTDRFRSVALRAISARRQSSARPGGRIDTYTCIIVLGNASGAAPKNAKSLS